MDAESTADKLRRRSTSRSTVSRRSTEDSDSNESSIGKEPPTKDSELHNGGVCDADELPKESNETTAEGSGVNTKGGEKPGDRSLRVGDKWKLHLDLSDSCSLSGEEGSDVDSPSVQVSAKPAERSQDENQKTTDASRAVQDDCSVASDTSQFHGFEDASCDQEYIDALVEAINFFETTEYDCCYDDQHHSAETHTTEAESENEHVRTYLPDDDSNSSSHVSQQDTAKSVSSPAPAVSNKGRPRTKYSNSPVPSNKSGYTKKWSIDVTSPIFRKPLDQGWKREVVFRSTGDPTNTKRQCDIYYFTPSGRKVRSNREVLENLVGTDLTLDNFTFFKEPLGVNDPEKERIRDARRISLPIKDSGSPTAAVPGGSGLSGKRAQKLKSPAGDLQSPDQTSGSSAPSIKQQALAGTEEETDGSSEASSSSGVSRDPVPPTPSTSSAASPQKIPPAVAGPSGINKGKNRLQPYAKLARSFPRIKVTSPRATRGGRQHTSPRGKVTSSPASGADGNMEMGMLPPMWKDKDGASTTKVLSSPGAAQNVQSGSPKGSGKAARGAKAGGQAGWVQSTASTTS